MSDSNGLRLPFWQCLLRKVSALWLLWLLAMPVCAEVGPSNVLVLDPSSGAGGGLFYQQAVASFRYAVNRDPVQQVSLFVESVQLNRFSGVAYEKNLSDHLASK